jgi:hypothetical protein
MRAAMRTIRVRNDATLSGQTITTNRQIDLSSDCLPTSIPLSGQAWIEQRHAWLEPVWIVALCLRNSYCSGGDPTINTAHAPLYILSAGSGRGDQARLVQGADVASKAGGYQYIHGDTMEE